MECDVNAVETTVTDETSFRPLRKWLSSSQRISGSNGVNIDTQENDTTSTKSTEGLSKSVSFDRQIKAGRKNLRSSLPSSFKKPIVLRRSCKRYERPEPKYGHDAVEYEAIRERVFQERAVVNAIEALLERGRMLMYLHDDVVALNDGRKEKKIRKLCIKRQLELIGIVCVFLLICLPVVLIMIYVCKIT